MRSLWRRRASLFVTGNGLPSGMSVHDRLVRLGSEPVPDPDAPWQSVVQRLEDRPLSWSSRIGASIRRPAAAFMATTLLSTGAAYAAGVPPVRVGVDRLVGGAFSLFGGSGGSEEDGVGTRSEDRNRSDDASSERRSQDHEAGARRDGRSDAPKDSGKTVGGAPAPGAGGPEPKRDEPERAETDADRAEDREDREEDSEEDREEVREDRGEDREDSEEDREDVRNDRYEDREDPEGRGSGEFEAGNQAEGDEESD